MSRSKDPTWGSVARAGAVALATALTGVATGQTCGDADGDGDCDGSDLGIVSAAYGLNDQGDLNGDGVTDQHDLAWVIMYHYCDSVDDVDCGPCQAQGTGAIDIALVAVDNSAVLPGDDPVHADFHGGVTHFTFDVVDLITSENFWTSQASTVELVDDRVEFFNHDLGEDIPPLTTLGFDATPALEFDSFYAEPPELFVAHGWPGFSVHPDWSGSSVTAVWWNPHQFFDDLMFTVQRFTIIVRAGDSVVPAVLPDDCPHDFHVLAHVNSRGTSAATGSELVERDFTIVDLAAPLCPGDVDGDDTVGQADLGILLATYELPADDPLYDNRGDLNCDGAVDQSDLGILLANYGQDC
jgi:hypothetical protein